MNYNRLQTCDSKSHEDIVVVYDSYATSGCPLCEARDEIKDLSQKNDELENEKTDLEYEVGNKEAQIDQLETENGDLLNEINELKAQVEEYEKA